MKRSKSLSFAVCVTLATALGLLGCDSNPYPADANLVPKPPPVVAPKPEPEKSYELDAPSTVTCNAQLLCKIPIQYGVTGDDAVLTFDGLPDGAVFDSNTNQILWRPTVEQVSDQLYVVLVNLRGNEDTDIHLQRAIGLMVKAVVP